MDSRSVEEINNISSEEDTNLLQYVAGINYVRPPTLNFRKVESTKDYTEYEIETKKENDKKIGNNSFVDNLNSFIYCNDVINIKIPKKSFMINKKGKKKFAYAIGMFPNPKNGKAAYLDGCILAALGLKRQNTQADVICFITHDISDKDEEKLSNVFDKVIRVPYISPYDMGGKGDLKTIMMDPKLFDNCNGYTKDHPYVHVFFKLHIFNPKLFPYEKVCFVDSDLVPLNYYDSLFMLDCPAGFVEYRKKFPYLEALNWDRCDFLKHGEKIPKELTDVDKKTGADVNAGLLLVKPNKEEYESMIKELTSPLDTWMGKDKLHKGFYNFNFNTPSGREYIENSYCYPEQNYLTKRFSGKWHYIEFSFQSWALDPCNSFGIHMAAFNPKPWFKQPAGTSVKINKKFNPYLEAWEKKNIRIPLAIDEDSKKNYENISYSYEIFNELIIWGLVNYPELSKFFIHDTKIYGTKVSFDRDVFKDLSPKDNIDFMLLKDIVRGKKHFNKLSLTQKYISDLLNKNKETAKKIKDKYPQICYTKLKNRDGEFDYNFKIIKYPKHTSKPEHNYKSLLNKNKIPFGKFKGEKIKTLDKDYIKKLKKIKDKDLKKVLKTRKKKSQKGGRKSRKTKRRKTNNTKRRKTTNIKRRRTNRKIIKDKLIYFSMKNCPYCIEFNEMWNKLSKKYKNKIIMNKVMSTNTKLTDKYNIFSYPKIILVKNNPIHFEYDRNNINDFHKFLKENKSI
jgi:thiol-disulfide isomerase/thioredoxin